ncbi:MAG: [protein-PII] uridylyltransferase [Nitrospinota bacterium]
MTKLKKHSQEIQAARDGLMRRHLAGAGGMEISQSWTKYVDERITAMSGSVGDSSPGAGANFALVALGGYGRVELNPYSDIDLLFLYEIEVEKSGSSLPARLIPALWDIGFKVGHSTRTIANCLEIAAHDTVSRTSMMESRFLLGSREMFDLFNHRFKAKINGKRPDMYLREKRLETEQRHNRFHNTLFLTEPDIKESPGGLRDYHTARWMATARYDVAAITGMTERGLLQKSEAEELTHSIDFMLRIRNDLHFHSRGPHDTLDYGLQPGVAKRLGYGGDRDEAVVEMMRTYYRAADSIYRFGQSITDQAARYRPTIKHIFKRLRRHPELAPSVFAGPEEIYVKGLTPRELGRSPKKVIEILRLMGEKALRPSPGLRRMFNEIGQMWKMEKPDSFEDALAGFRELLRMPDPVELLRFMRDGKILTTVIPEFHAIRYMTPFDLYHKFTVDDHSFLAIRELDNLKRNDSSECSLLRLLYEQEERKDLLRLTLILHDIGKGSGNHESHEEIDPAIVQKIGYDRDETETVRRLVKIHLLMSRISQRRDMHSESTIKEYCDQVGGEETAKRLYLLTFADMSAVGPGVWNSWKADLLKELHTKAAAVFRGEDPMKLAGPGKTILREKVDDKLRGFINGMPDRYLHLRSHEEMEKDAALFKRYKGGGPAAVHHALPPGSGAGSLTVMARDKLGLLHELVGILASKNVDILDAKILTHKDGVAVDFFKVNGPDGKPITDKHFWLRVEKEINKVVGGEKRVEELMQSRKKLMVTPKNLPYINAIVRVLNDVSLEHTVIETTARDRMGLLYDITRTLGLAGIDIVSAHISTEGHRAMDTFYVTEKGGKKITDPDNIDWIKRELRQVLSRTAL